MPRARNIKPGFFKNEYLSECSLAGRLLFIGLWTLADRRGRLDDRPKRIHAEIFPYDRVNVDAELAALEKAGFIKRYSVGSDKYIQVTNFEKHQYPHVKEQESTIPAPDMHHACTPESLILNPESPLPITESGETDAPALPVVSPADAVVTQWNEMALRSNVPPVRALNTDRRDKIRTRLRDPAFDYPAILAAIERSPFLRGENDRGWKVGFDFVFDSPKNFLKILEGKYDNAETHRTSYGGNGHGRETFTEDTIRRLVKHPARDAGHGPTGGNIPDHPGG